MDEADGVEPAKHEVWSTRESAVVQAVSEPASVDGSTKSEFRPCVPASDPCHYARPGRAVHGVGHRCPCKEPLEADCRQQTTREVFDMFRLDSTRRRGTGPVGPVKPAFSADRAAGSGRGAAGAEAEHLGVRL